MTKNKTKEKKPEKTQKILVRTRADFLKEGEKASRENRPVILYTEAGAAAFSGPSYFLILAREVQKTYPTAQITLVLDAGERVESALAILRAYRQIFPRSSFRQDSFLDPCSSQKGSVMPKVRLRVRVAPHVFEKLSSLATKVGIEIENQPCLGATL